jgi:hypothetical protein
MAKKTKPKKAPKPPPAKPPPKPDEPKTEAPKPETTDQQETVRGYSGSPHEGEKAPVRPKGASGDAVISPLGAAEPSIEIREKQTG